MIQAFLLGLTECRGSVGMTYDDNPFSHRSLAYDRGRSLGCWLWRIP